MSCPAATCTVDASGSTDTAPGTITSYAWDFGDGTTGTGLTTTHTYTTGGAKTITLVVTDNQGLPSAPATRTANPVVGGGVGAQPVPGHTRLVPDRPRTNTPLISGGEIWDIEVIPQLNRVFIAGNFTSLANTVSPTTTINQANLASYNLTTGLIDTQFRPTFNGGVTAVEASPDGTKLFVGGSFNTVNGVAKQKVASLNLTTGAPLTTFGFTNSTNNQVQSLAASNSTLYVGGRYTRINGQLRTGLAAVNAASGVVDLTFNNSISGGIGVNGQLGVPQLKLTHDNSKLLVVHTGRQIAGQDRLGMALIDTATKQLLPFRSTLWDENLARVGGVTRICCADIAPDDSYFIVTSGSGGDAPPISDTAIAYPLNATSIQDSDVQPLWISRHFDSIYSVAITEQAVYLGGHFQFIESQTSDDPWPGLDNVGYGTGQGLAGYGLGDQVVRRDHIAAVVSDQRQDDRVEPDRRLELVRGRQGDGGHLARPVRRRRRDVQGRGAHRPGRVLRLQHRGQPAGAARHDDHHARSRAAWSPTTCRSPSPVRRGSPPAVSAASRCRSRTATAASTSRTTAPLHHVRTNTANTLQRDARRRHRRHRTWSIPDDRSSPPTATCWSRRRRSPPPPVAPATRPRRPRRSSRSAPRTRRRPPPSAGRAASRRRPRSR